LGQSDVPALPLYRDESFCGAGGTGVTTLLSCWQAANKSRKTQRPKRVAVVRSIVTSSLKKWAIAASPCWCIMTLMRLLIATMLCLLPLMAQDAPKGGQKKGPPGPPKNLKVLPAEGLLQTMRSFTVALGVRCDHCHVLPDMASDENPKKDVARMMIGMVHDINAKFPADAKVHVTCYTCHRGAVLPLETAPPAQ
jgi:photosynthetic reaction center cytochrome c subunit